MRGRELLFFASFAVFAGVGATAHGAGAQRAEDSWTSLSDDVSRAALFEKYAGVQNKAQPKTFAFPYTFRFPYHTTHEPNGGDRVKTAVFGIDISHYQGAKFPFKLLNQKGVAFVYLKATQGTGSKDPQFANNITSIKAAEDDSNKIVHGAFHFLSSDPKESGKEQADSFVDYVMLHGGFQKGDLPPALDLEWDVTCQTCADRWLTNKRSSTEIIQTTLDFVAEVKRRTGRVPLLYTNKVFLSSVHITKAADVERITSMSKNWIFDLDSNDRKLEHPADKNNLSSLLWQFSWKAKLDNGFSGDLDADVFQGTPDDFKAALIDN